MNPTPRLSPADVAAAVRDLPALPAVVQELIAALNDDAAGPERLAAVISRDQALAARTLRLANSSFYGVSRQVVSVADATAVLGLRTLRSVAMAAGMCSGFPPTRCAGFDFTAFWRHALGTALCADALAQARQLDAGAAFALGLLHDIGCLALASRFTEPYAGVLRHQREHDGPLLASERAMLGIDHAEVGALIAARWHFAPAMVAAIAAHHQPPDAANATATATATTTVSLIDVVHVADNMAHALDLSGLPHDAVPPLDMGAWLRLGLEEDRCLPLLAQVEAEHTALCAALF